MAQRKRSKSFSDIQGQLERITRLYEENPTEENLDRIGTAMEVGRRYFNNIVKTIGLPYEKFTDSTKKIPVPKPYYTGKYSVRSGSPFENVRQRLVNVSPAKVGG